MKKLHYDYNTWYDVETLVKPFTTTPAPDYSGVPDGKQPYKMSISNQGSFSYDGYNLSAAPSLLQQLKDFREVRDTIAEDLAEEKENDDDKGDNMSWIIEKAFDLLPGLLQKKNNDFQAVGHDVSNNPFVTGIIQDNPELAQEFFTRAVEKYGPENAQKLAHGFGLNMEFKQPQAG